MAVRQGVSRESARWCTRALVFVCTGCNAIVGNYAVSPLQQRDASADAAEVPPILDASDTLPEAGALHDAAAREAATAPGQDPAPSDAGSPLDAPAQAGTSAPQQPGSAGSASISHDAGGGSGGSSGAAGTSAGTAGGSSGAAGTSAGTAGATPPSDASLPECSAGMDEQLNMPCGPCGKGTQARTRTCTDGGQWSEWTDEGSCDTSALECEPNRVEMLAPAACGPCSRGTLIPTRVCSPDTCTWGAPLRDESSCQLPATYCRPGETKQQPAKSCGACNKGTAAVTQTCDATTCTFGAAVTGACMYLGNTCDPNGPTVTRCVPPRDPGTNQAYQEWCFSADYGDDNDPAAIAIRCTYGSPNKEACSATVCPECY